MTRGGVAGVPAGALGADPGELLAGTYQPTAVRRHEIPKSGGGVRQLGIPTVLDRFIQQAILQVLQPIFDPTFSSTATASGRDERTTRSVRRSGTSRKGRWVVDVDLEKFFDRVNHDVLMGRLAKRIGGQAAAQDHPPLPGGRHHGRRRGGGAARGDAARRTSVAAAGERAAGRSGSKLERAGTRFVRYADDCNVYVRSKRAGERVMERMVRLYAKLKLKVNEEKSTVARVWERKFLGYSFWVAKGRLVKRRVAPKALEDSRSASGRSRPERRAERWRRWWRNYGAYLRGWKAYFRLADTPGVFHDLDQWIADGCGWCNSNSGSAGRRSTGNCKARCADGAVTRAAAAHGEAGGGSPDTAR
jgi:RNA-directed DNA polymerase